MINLFKTYNKAKGVFVRPKVKIHFGRWINSPGLPVWRRGGWVTLAKSHQYYTPNSTVWIKTGSKGDKRPDGSAITCETYTPIRHKLPKGSQLGVWRRDIRKKLRKWRLGWLRPVYILPTWLAFYIFNYDVIYKWKYDSIRYEYPPQFTIVFFGLALTITLQPPLEDEHDSMDSYWESLLAFLYQEECGKSVTKTLHYCGQWTGYQPDGGKIRWFQLRKSHIQPKYHVEYDKAVEKYYYNKIMNNNDSN